MRNKHSHRYNYVLMKPILYIMEIANKNYFKIYYSVKSK